MNNEKRKDLKFILKTVMQMKLFRKEFFEKVS